MQALLIEKFELAGLELDQVKLQCASMKVSQQHPKSCYNEQQEVPTQPANA